MDLRRDRIPNTWHSMFWVLGLVWQLWRIGPGGILFYLAGIAGPLFCLFPLFRYRMLGAGDIKLFSVLGGFFGIRMVFRCMICSFLIGGVMAFWQMYRRGILRHRLKYFLSFFQENGGQMYASFFDLNRQQPIYREAGFGPECMHFSVPIFLAVLLKTGGMY